MPGTSFFREGSRKTCPHDLGEREVEHGVRSHVFNLCTEEPANPAPSARFAEQKNQLRKPSPSKNRSSWIVQLVLFFLSYLGFQSSSSLPRFFTPYKGEDNSPLRQSAATAVPEKSIAVLPFVNMSADRATSISVTA